MDPHTKDVIDAVAKIGGLVTVVAAAAGFWLQFRRWQDDRQRALEEQEKSRALRTEELRWRKASLGRDALDEFLADPLAIDAMRMLDWEVRNYKIDGKDVRVSRDQVLRGLRTKDLEFDATESYVRDCFDAFFGHWQLIEHFLRVNLLAFDDVAYPASYYAEILTRYRPQFQNFLNYYEYGLATAFLARFDASWAQQPTVTSRAGPQN